MFSTTQESSSVRVVSSSPWTRLLFAPRDWLQEAPRGANLRKTIQRTFGFDPGRVHSGQLLTCTGDFATPQHAAFLQEVLTQPVEQKSCTWSFQNPYPWATHDGSIIIVSQLPGVTDDEGFSAQQLLTSLNAISSPHSQQHIFSHQVWWFEDMLEGSQLKSIAQLLGNPLVQRFDMPATMADFHYVPTMGMAVGRFDADSCASLTYDAQVDTLNAQYGWSFSSEEMDAIKHHFRGEDVIQHRAQCELPINPTRCEMEMIAQTWSEHCKHKEFAATIEFTNQDTREHQTIHSLFKTYIERPARTLAEALRKSGRPWVVKLFNDNAGCVAIDAERLLVWKVETHNAPSALDPYGGALTGIVGVNRDPLGTGAGGTRLLFNTNVLCFGYPNDNAPLHPGQWHPLRILQGVTHGIADGGNKSGVPTVSGATVFADEFRGRPLVFCGTAGILPARRNGLPLWEKNIVKGDRIVMAGGRVGRDGIHGATYSSLELTQHTPQSVVQIGSPIVQKRLSDFLERACDEGLIRTLTDNGAGGLSSSVGELAQLAGGARIELTAVPLKYNGLEPWEILISESQERMTLVVDPQRMSALQRLAADYEVEISDMGAFNDSGYFDVFWNGKAIASLSLEFLHHGVPTKHLVASWSTPPVTQLEVPRDISWHQTLVQLLARPNIASKEPIIRRYDHEVKGRSILKSLMGWRGEAPQDAAVMRLDFESWQGVAVSHGIYPRYAMRDPYAAAAGALDEAVRQIIAVGGKLPAFTRNPFHFWSVNDNFCVPDSVYHPEKNPDGKEKLGRLVRMCQALADISLTYQVPMTSGKDSMKNDFRYGATKVSIPPTVLFSAVSKISDVRQVVSSEFKSGGDAIYLVGETYAELGESEVAQLLGLSGGAIPQVRADDALQRYRRMSNAHDARLLESCHDLSDGGCAVALAESAFGGHFGAHIEIPDTPLSVFEWLFSESHSRFLVTVRPENQGAFELLMGPDALWIGTVTAAPFISVTHYGRPLMHSPIDELLTAWCNGLRNHL